jgi:hypothetical protein
MLLGESNVIILIISLSACLLSGIIGWTLGFQHSNDMYDSVMALHHAKVRNLMKVGKPERIGS